MLISLAIRHIIEELIKSFFEGEFVKEYLMSVAKLICLDK